MKESPTSNYDFAYLIENGMLYVDKTDYLHQLVESKNSTFFLSRPRRFGKSLTVSSLSYIFQGRRDLFAGLKIDAMDYDWMQYPVVNLNMSKMNYSSPEDFTNELKGSLFDIADSLSITVSKEAKPGLIFNDILTKAAAQSPTGKVVLLIDEYDAPLVNNIDSPHLEEMRAILENFYIQIKAANAILRFTFMTGVTRFSKVSVFSKLNHMVDISMDKAYATMLGFTQEELETHYGERAAQLAKEEGVEYGEMLAMVKRWYNGYRFHYLAETVYNPVSVGRFMKDGEFKNWWFETGSPTFVIKQLNKQDVNYFDMMHEKMSEELFSEFNPANLQARSLLYQTGYLTIVKGYKGRFGTPVKYQLGFPNAEVEQSYTAHLLSELGTMSSDRVRNSADMLSEAVYECDIPEMVRVLKFHLAAIPYDGRIESEGVFKSMIYLLLRMGGLMVTVERYTNIGRMDTVIETEDHVFIFEYKYGKSAAEAMKQIEEMGYAEQFIAKGKQIHLIAMNYDLSIHNIGDDWIYNRINS
ncbi:MAG: AAA family ATPase [Bacteroidales bacterium]